MNTRDNFILEISLSYFDNIITVITPRTNGHESKILLCVNIKNMMLRFEKGKYYLIVH